MRDDTTKILATLPNDVVDEDKHLTLTAALLQAITTSKFIHDETKQEKDKSLINEGQWRAVANKLHVVSYEFRWTCQRGNRAMSSAVVDLDAEKLGWSPVSHNPIKVLVTGIFTPFIGLTGSAMGFLWRECR